MARRGVAPDLYGGDDVIAGYGMAVGARVKMSGEASDFNEVLDPGPGEATAPRGFLNLNATVDSILEEAVAALARSGRLGGGDIEVEELLLAAPWPEGTRGANDASGCLGARMEFEASGLTRGVRTYAAVVCNAVVWDDERVEVRELFVDGLAVQLPAIEAGS